MEYFTSASSILRSGGISISSEMLVPLFLMALGFLFLFIYILLLSVEISLKKMRLSKGKNLLISKMEKILNFISMGGNSFYVWTSYFIPLILIFLFVIIQRRKLKNIQKYDYRNIKG